MRVWHAELSQQLEFAVRERARLTAELEAAQKSAEKSVDMLNNRIKGLLSEVEAARNAKSRAVTNLGSLTVSCKIFCFLPHSLDGKAGFSISP